ncbi:hypothetical protein BH10ACI1_BH10ACI1_05160 [soil metagenome]
MSVISAELKNKIRQTARNRCGYCLTPQEIVSIPFEMEHLQPIAEGESRSAEFAGDSQPKWSNGSKLGGFGKLKLRKQIKKHEIN